MDAVRRGDAAGHLCHECTLCIAHNPLGRRGVANDCWLAAVHSQCVALRQCNSKLAKLQIDADLPAHRHTHHRSHKRASDSAPHCTLHPVIARSHMLTPDHRIFAKPPHLRCASRIAGLGLLSPSLESSYYHPLLTNPPVCASCRAVGHRSMVAAHFHHHIW